MSHYEFEKLINESEERERLDEKKIKNLTKQLETLKQKLKKSTDTIKSLQANDSKTGAVDLTKQAELQKELAQVRSRLKEQTLLATTAQENLDKVQKELDVAHEVLREQEAEIQNPKWVNIGSCQFRTTDPSLHI
tara:strand:- start:750 stop:1154 length:405 start_codon:yes stop_codon:yes gene_type:complete